MGEGCLPGHARPPAPPLPPRSRQAATLGRKRREYIEMVPQYYDISNAERSEEELTALRQVVGRGYLNPRTRGWDPTPSAPHTNH